MSRIVSKLNLNKTPQLVDNNSLVMAKNIRLLEDGSIGPDTSLKNVESVVGADYPKYVGQIVGLNNKIYFFKEGNVGNSFIDRVKIYEYDEVNDSFTLVNCGWQYSGGKITGCVTVNNTGESILTICEYDTPNNKLIPIKHINLSKCKSSDNESIYTQAPDIPITNLFLFDTYIKNIPYGVYQFFIRYKIHDNFYTTWFPCTKELFAGTRRKISTIQGSLKHTDLTVDSNFSFIFKVNHLYEEYCSYFEEFQLGFIISNDNGVFARAWKHFLIENSNDSFIYFDYNNSDIEEIDINDLLNVNFDIFNVKNIVPYKNKLYISNYKETNFNEDLERYASGIDIKFKIAPVFDSQVSDYYFNGYPMHESSIQNVYDLFGTYSFKEIFNLEKYCNTVISQPEATSVGPISYAPSELPYHTNHIEQLYIIDNNNNSQYIIGTNIIPAHLEALPDYNYNTVSAYTISKIKEKILGVNIDGIYYINISGHIYPFNKIIVKYATYVTNEYIDEEDGQTYIDLTTTIHSIEINISLKSELISSISKYLYKEKNTLLPFTKYNFYIHYVKQNGIYTNGYFIGSKEIKRYCKGYVPVDSSEVSGISQSEMTELSLSDLSRLDDILFYEPEHNTYAYYNVLGTYSYYKLLEETEGEYIIYPTFTGITCPPGYVGCFISIHKCGNEVAQGFYYEGNVERTFHKVDCLELDALLYNTLDNITIKRSKGTVITKDGIYFSSSSTNNSIINQLSVKNIGCAGHIEFYDTLSESLQGEKLWIIFDSKNEDYNKALIKLTPFIALDRDIAKNYNNYNDLNTPGYLCEVMKLDRQFCDAITIEDSTNITGYYVSGDKVYTRNIIQSSVELNEVETELKFHDSIAYYILSNFNLNYLSLSKDLKPFVRDYVEDPTSDPKVHHNQFITVVDSLLASFILELKGMYKDYVRKTYAEYNKISIINFDNTLRASSIDVDEIYRYIYRFDASEYYNVPTQRGIITNLIAIVNTLYVHCEHSLFKFTDNKTLNAQGENVTLQESDIFNSGISEVFDAQYGYAGLKKKEQSLITYNSYVFYDEVVQSIYAFGGEQQIGIISDSIKKLIKDIQPIDVTFIADENNDRFFVNFITGNGNVCLSYSFRNKSFISIHDINYKFGFHTRRNTYFVHEDKTNNTITGWSIYKIVDHLIESIPSRGENDVNTNIIYYTAYQSCYEKSLIVVPDNDNDITLNEKNCVNSCIDIIINTEYEKVKVLNYINWLCSLITKYGHTENLVAEESLNRYYPGNKIRIYSDNTKTHLIDLLDSNGNPKISNNIDIDQPNSWQYIRFNCGFWSMNYFRDVQNITDIFNYKANKNQITGGTGHSQTTDLTPKVARQDLTQENSLLYGKYFVVRFIFNNKNFKLENIILNMNDYDKTK